MNIPGFEDVNLSKMLVEMLMALPCLIASILVFLKVLKKKDTPLIEKKKLTLERIKDSLDKNKIKKRLIAWVNSLKLWKWFVFIVLLGTYLSSNLIMGNKIDIISIEVFIGFSIAMFVAGIFNTADLEDFLLICATGLLGCRHGVYFSSFNIFYPIFSFFIAMILFLPGELKAYLKEKKNDVLKKDNEVIYHKKLVYFLPAGYMLSIILYFLTSF